MMNRSWFAAFKNHGNACSFLVTTRCCCIADTARSEGIATWFSSTPLSVSISMLAPSLCALSASMNILSIAFQGMYFIICNRNFSYLKSLVVHILIFNKSVLVRIGLLILSIWQFSAFPQEYFRLFLYILPLMLQFSP